MVDGVDGGGMSEEQALSYLVERGDVSFAYLSQFPRSEWPVVRRSLWSRLRELSLEDWRVARRARRHLSAGAVWRSYHLSALAGAVRSLPVGYRAQVAEALAVAVEAGGSGRVTPRYSRRGFVLSCVREDVVRPRQDAGDWGDAS